VLILAIESGDYYVKVTLIGRGEHQVISSPGLTQEMAERDLQTIHEAEGMHDPLKLDWLSTRGNRVLAAHIEGR
jgi:hypothetical protein